MRYQCPQCGAIVGPLKMLLLSEDALAADYRSHYAIYEEGDSTEAEMRTFFAMKPRLDGTYLNYGAGCWSKTLPALRGKGFHVFGYDPYSADGGAEGILTTPQELTAMKFDGIFSNNLLEHLRHPVSDIKMMKNFLNSGGVLSHTTPCYEYLYDYTRFHLVFYTGHSMSVLCERTGLEVVSHEISDDLEYNNYVFRPR